MKVIIDIDDEGQPALRFSVVEGSNSTDQLLLKKFIRQAVTRGLRMVDLDEGDRIEKGEKREYAIQIESE